MKNIYSYHRSTFLVLIFTVLIVSGCNEEFLKPEPLSFFSPENALVDKEGMESLLTTNEHLMRREYTIPQLRVEVMMSDIGACAGCTLADFAQNLYPSSSVLSNAWYNVQQWWVEWYNVIKYSNTVISRVDDIELTDQERNELIAKAMFYRSRAYYRLTHQYGDVPLVLEEVVSPRLDFYTFERESILRKMKQDMDQYVQHLPLTAPMGTVNRGAGFHLLTKINLALGEFEDAVTSASQIINGGTYALMTERFGAYKDQDKITEGYRAYVNGGEVELDIIWDLHRPENITSPENKEVLLAVVDRLNIAGNDDQNARVWNIPYESGMRNMRNNTPRWGAVGAIKTPSGANGIMAVDDEFGQYRTLGHGEGFLRPSLYMAYDIWNDPNDLRGKQPNWWKMTDLVFNNTALIGTPDEIYYGKHLDYSARPPGADSLRVWFPFFNKFLNEDPRTVPNGANQDWYVYRVAGTYLLRAEAYFWMGDLARAADDINAIRTRAGASPISPDEVNIGIILDERAKELFNEEPRKSEMVRMSYLFAKTGKEYNGKTYSLNDFSNNNFWYDRSIEKNVLYRENRPTAEGPSYRIAPRNVLWPIPESNILANSLGHINQTPGYSGSETNINPKIYPDDYE